MPPSRKVIGNYSTQVIYHILAILFRAGYTEELVNATSTSIIYIIITGYSN